MDKQKVETYVRYAEAFTPEVKIAIDDPTPSPFKGYFRVLVHLSAGTHKLDRLYYVTADGQQFLTGNIWNLNASPFIDTLQHLPTAGPSFGPSNAQITLVIFSDFECPYCRELAKTIRDNIPQKYPNEVRVIFEDFPIDSIHKWARAASEAAHCVESQKTGAFWTFHDWIFEHQQEVNETNLRDQVLAFAKQQNLDSLRVSACMETHATAQEVKQNEIAGAALQISKTPTLFINGRMVDGAVPWTTLDRIIKIELNRPKEIAAPVIEKCCEVTIPAAVQK
ncbi:MAG: thioredoxin domain-containing protein [Acidobacteriaceae bacterium]|nr:thioredoxin domain-containing protein [Acidobacteriaceae bacterium]MBV9781671.1 thioredoxin domain-containing protein [Acidobacteriaceae bacterium]